MVNKECVSVFRVPVFLTDT